MSDLISRQAALDAINHICPIDTEYDCALLDRVDVRCVLSDLPSAEPEQVIKIGQRSGKTLESAINYLQSTGWLQEHDRILTESAEPERKWIPVSEALPKDAEFVLLTIRRLSKSYDQTPFISVGFVSWNQNAWWCAHDGDCDAHNVEVLAWMPLPEPYKGVTNE